MGTAGKVRQHPRISLFIPSTLCNRKQSPRPAQGHLSGSNARYGALRHQRRNDSKLMKESEINMEGECIKKK